jgi:hypothetical protein
MNDERSSEPDTKSRRGFLRSVGRLLRIGVPLAFIALTAWNVVQLVGEGAPERGGTSESTTNERPPPGPADELTIAVVGDIGMAETGQATLKSMASMNPDLYLALGGFSDSGPGSEHAWCDQVRSRVGPTVPVQIVAGNREEDGGQDGFIANYEACVPDRMESVGTYGREYYFDLGKLARVIMISPDLTIDGTQYFYGAGNDHQHWLEAAIDEAHANGIDWVMVGTHNNCISTGQYHCLMNKELFDVLIAKRVDVVFSAQDRTYQRSKQVSTSDPGCVQVVIESFDPGCVVDDGSDGRYTQGAGTVFVVAGAAGAPLDDVNMTDPEAAYFHSIMGRNQDPRHGWAAVTITQSKLDVAFIGSSPGSFEDRFSVEAMRPGKG